jgi:hypothetical protein
MILRRLCCLVALGALLLSSGCCWRQRCCNRPVMFPRLRGACCEHGCQESTCATCCHSNEFVGMPVMNSPEPAMALPMPRSVPGPMKPAN